jgi:hypothetical protein
MPRDVVTEWARQARGGENIRPDWALVRTAKGLLGRTTNQQGGIISWSDAENWLGQPLRNFAAVLDAVAERRVAERMRGQTQAPTATATQPEPRRFSDVRPDRHGWRWWLVGAENSNDGLFGVAEANRRICVQNGRFYWLDRSHVFGDFTNLDHIWNRRTVIPTDEQGNPVSWEAAGFAAGGAQETVQRAANDATIRAGNTDGFSAEPPTPPRPSQFNNNPTMPPLTPEGFQQALETVQMAPGLYQETLDWVTRQISQVIIGVDTAKAPPITTLPLPLPRFTADELDDTDHSKTTKLNEVTLRRGKLPTVEQIAKYREVRAKRTGGTVANALKESRIDCEVAQYVLERWAGGLGDADTVLLLHRCCDVPAEVGCCPPPFDPKQGEVDQRSQDFLRTHNAALDTSEKPSPTVQRERQEAEERRQRLAALRQRLAAERAAQLQETAKESAASRFDLIEPDPHADPAASIRAWEARQAAAKVRPVAAPPRIAKPAAAPRRPAIEVVDAEVDGLSRSEAFAALFGRALNGGC